MAAVSTTAMVKKVHACTPWLIVEYSLIESGTDGGSVLHTEGRAPDFYKVVLSEANPGASEISITAVSSTAFTVDCQADSKTFSIIAVWFTHASNGLNNVD